MSDTADTDDRADRANALDRFARAGDAAPRGDVMAIPQQVFSSGGDRIVGAQEVAVYRNEGKVLEKLAALAAAAGDDWYYRYPVKNKKENRTDWIEGPSIKLANDLARIYGNCDLDIRVQDLGASWLFYARFTDFETGFSLTRPFQQSKNASRLGGADDARRLDIAFQIGVSKAERNVVVNALQTFADYAFEEARNSIVEKIGKKLGFYRDKTLVRLSEIRVDIRRVEAIRGRAAKDWLAPDVARTIAEIKAVTDGMATADDTWPVPGSGDANATDQEVDRSAGLDQFADDDRHDHRIASTTIANASEKTAAAAAAGEQADAGEVSGAEGGEPKTETAAAAHTASPPADIPPQASTPAEGDSRPADASPRASRGAAQEPDASSGASEAAGEATSQPKPRPAAAFSAAEKKKLTAYSKALENATSVNGLQKASQRGWEGDMPDEGTHLDQAIQAIFTAHMKRVQGEESIANTDNAVRKIVG